MVDAVLVIMYIVVVSAADTCLDTLRQKANRAGGIRRGGKMVWPRGGTGALAAPRLWALSGHQAVGKKIFRRKHVADGAITTYRCSGAGDGSRPDPRLRRPSEVINRAGFVTMLLEGKLIIAERNK